MNRLNNSTIAKILIYQLIAYLTCSYPINALAQETKRVQDYIAVLDLQTKKGVPEEVKDPLTERLQTEIVNSRKYKVVDRAHRDQILKEQGFQLKDCVTSECIVEAGQLLGVGKIVTGSISKLGESYYINVQLINVETGVVEASADEMCEKCSLSELVYPTAIVAKKLMGLPYEPYRPTKGVTRVPERKSISSPIIEMERIEEFEKRYQELQDTLKLATLENYKKAKQLSDELKNDLRYESSDKAVALYKKVKETDKVIENEMEMIESIGKLELTDKIVINSFCMDKYCTKYLYAIVRKLTPDIASRYKVKHGVIILKIIRHGFTVAEAKAFEDSVDKMKLLGLGSLRNTIFRCPLKEGDIITHVTSYRSSGRKVENLYDYERKINEELNRKRFSKIEFYINRQGEKGKIACFKPYLLQ